MSNIKIVNTKIGISKGSSFPPGKPDFCRSANSKAPLAKIDVNGRYENNVHATPHDFKQGFVILLIEDFLNSSTSKRELK